MPALRFVRPVTLTSLLAAQGGYQNAYQQHMTQAYVDYNHGDANQSSSEETVKDYHRTDYSNTQAPLAAVQVSSSAFPLPCCHHPYLLLTNNLEAIGVCPVVSCCLLVITGLL